MAFYARFLLLMCSLACLVPRLAAQESKDAPHSPDPVTDGDETKGSTPPQPTSPVNGKVPLQADELRPVQTVLLSQMSEDISGGGGGGATFYVDSHIEVLNLSFPGGRFRLWDVTKLEESSCLARVMEGSQTEGKEFEFVVQKQQQQQQQQPERHGDEPECRELTAGSCTEKTQTLVDGHEDQEEEGEEGDKEEEGGGLRYRETCAEFLSIDSPGAGLRYIELFPDKAQVSHNDTTAKVTVTGLSRLDFHVIFVDPVSSAELQHPPVAGEKSGILIGFSEKVVNSSMSSLVTYSEDGRVLQRSTLLEDFTLLHIPRENFYVGIDGVDDAGEKFQRIQPELVKPRTLVLSFTTPAHMEELNPQQNLDIRFRLRNKGKADSFSVKVMFTTFRDYLTTDKVPDVVYMAQDANKEVHILVKVDPDLSQKIASQLTVEVMRTSDKSCTFLHRRVEAAPSAFGEDKKPPSCSVVQEHSFCDLSVTCENSNWTSVVAVHDMSGVYRAFFYNYKLSSSLSTSIEYKRVRGRLMATALIARNCCVQNAMLMVEDYMGNKQVCTLGESHVPPPYISSSGTNGRLTPALDVIDSGDTTAAADSQSVETTTQARSERGFGVTTADVEDNSDRGVDPIWTVRLLFKLKLAVISLGSVLCVVLLAIVVAKCYRKEHQPKKTAAHGFYRKRSQRTSRKHQTSSKVIEMERMEKFRPMSPDILTDIGNDYINKAHKSDTDSLDRQQESSFDTGDRDTRLGVPETEDAFHSTHSSCRRRHPHGDSQAADKTTAHGKTEKCISQLNISDFEPKNKKEIYESILQFRDLLAQLETRRTRLMSAMHHTVPRVRIHDVQRSEPGWDKLTDHDQRHGHYGTQDDQQESDIKSEKLVTPSKSANETTDNTTGGGHDETTPSPTTAPVDVPLVSSPPRPTGYDSPDEVCVQLKDSGDHNETCSSGEERERTGGVAPDVPTSRTPPELSEGHVSMLIEGATQISLRHQIKELKDRLLQCNQDVEEVLRQERDYYERLSLAVNELESDFDENE